MRVVIVGASGRMGLAITRAALEHPEVMIVGAIDRADSKLIGQDIGTLAGIAAIGTRVSSDLTAALVDADVMIDFSSAEITKQNIAACVAARVAVLIGTTGLNADVESAAALAAEQVPLLIAANTSLGVTLLIELVRIAARALPDDFDIEIQESHHRYKKDAPSGTALALGRAAQAGRELPQSLETVRSGGSVRQGGEIGYAVLRGGDVVGDHTVAFLGAGERVSLTHQATDRAIFARGALKAAKFLCRNQPGRYQMSDIIGLKTKA
jgi:4-hydroxy-tetrahydrodipicolinate reductase